MRFFCAGAALLIALGVAPAAFAAPASQAVPPDVEFQATAALDSAEHGQPVNVFVLVTNKSGIALTHVVVALRTADFRAGGGLGSLLAATLGPYASIGRVVSIAPTDTATFGKHTVFLTLTYVWPLGRSRIQSTLAANVSVTVNRRFQDQATGFPGGTAAFLYLLLPVIPAFLSYDAVDKLRQHQGLQIPSFRQEYIPAAFLFAALLSFLMVAATHQDVDVQYSNPAWFVGVVLASALAGAVIPGARWVCATLRDRRWAFTPQDRLASYLEKALLGPQAPNGVAWATGTIEGVQWQGLLLRQPNGETVLGAALLASPNPNRSAEERDAILRQLTQIFAGDANLTNRNHRRQLLSLVKSGQVALAFRRKIMRGNEEVEQPVHIIGAPTNFEQIGDGTPDLLVRLTS